MLFNLSVLACLDKYNKADNKADYKSKTSGKTGCGEGAICSWRTEDALDYRLPTDGVDVLWEDLRLRPRRLLRVRAAGRAVWLHLRHSAWMGRTHRHLPLPKRLNKVSFLGGLMPCNESSVICSAIDLVIL